MKKENLVQLFGVVITLATVLVTVFAIIHLFAA